MTDNQLLDALDDVSEIDSFEDIVADREAFNAVIKAMATAFYMNDAASKNVFADSLCTMVNEGLKNRKATA